MDLRKKKDEPSVFASFLSLLSGNGCAHDQAFERFDSVIESGRHDASRVQSFVISVERDDNPYETVWVKTPHGAYAIVKTFAPFKSKSGLESVPAYALLFSHDTAFLTNIFFAKPNDPQRPQPSLAEIEKGVMVVAGRYESDILREDVLHGQRVEMAWALAAIRQHTYITENALRIHGAILSTGKKVWRSGSSVFWLRESEKDSDLYHCYYYANPFFGKRCLFLNDNKLKNRWLSGFLQIFSVRLTELPIPIGEADEFVRTNFVPLSRRILKGGDPYELNQGTGFSKIKRTIKKGTLRALQKTAHALRNLDVRTLTISLVITGVMQILFSIPMLAWGAASASTVLRKGSNSLLQAINRFLSPTQTLAQEIERDIALLFASHKKDDTVVLQERRGYIFNPAYLTSMVPVPVGCLRHAFPDALPYKRQQHENEHAKSIVLDTLGFQPGTVFSFEYIRNREFVLAQQPDGLDVYFDPLSKTAIAEKKREPHPHVLPKRSVRRLFALENKKHHVVAVRNTGRRRLLFETYPDLDSVSDSFFSSMHPSAEMMWMTLQNLTHSSLGPADAFPLARVLPAALQKKYLKGVSKALKAALGDFIDRSPAQCVDEIDRYIRSSRPNNMATPHLHEKKQREGGMLLSFMRQQRPVIKLD